MVEQHFVILFVKLAVAVSLASILTRSGRFQRMLMREERTLIQRVQMALVCSVIFGAGVFTRVLTNNAYHAPFILYMQMKLAGQKRGFSSMSDIGRAREWLRNFWLERVAAEQDLIKSLKNQDSANL